MANSVVINILAKVKGLNEVESMKAKLTGLSTLRVPPAPPPTRCAFG